MKNNHFSEEYDKTQKKISIEEKCKIHKKEYEWFLKDIHEKSRALKKLDIIVIYYIFEYLIFLNIKNGSDSLNENTEEEKMPAYLIMPNNKFKLFWDFYISL